MEKRLELSSGAKCFSCNPVINAEAECVGRNIFRKVHTVRLMGPCVAMLIGVHPASLSAACQVVGVTADGGGVVSCTGNDTLGVATAWHGDTVTVETGADVFKSYQETGELIGTADKTAVFTDGGDDLITNKATVGTKTEIEIDGSDMVYDGTGSFENRLYAEAEAVGIDSGTSVGKDTIVNNGTIGDVQAKATISAGEIRLDLLNMTDVDISLTSIATATGIKAGGSSEITNNGTVTVKADARITDWTSAPDINISDYGTVNATDTPHATAIGIQGGSGYDTITNNGTVSVSAYAYTSIPHVEVNAVDLAVAGAGIGTETSPMSATAIGIDAGNGGSLIVNAATGRITSDAYSSVNIESIALTLYDFTITADMRGKAGGIGTYVDAAAIGIEGGNGNDSITNYGEVSATAITKIISVGLGVGAEGVPSGLASPDKAFLEQPLFTVADATVTSASFAAGIRGGGGDDTIVNAGKVTVYAGPVDDGITPSIISTGASVSFPFLELTGLNDWLDKFKYLASWPFDYPPAIAIASAGISATSTAVGIDAGLGNDTIVNQNTVNTPFNVTAKSSATNIQAACSLQNVKSEGGTGWSMNVDLSLVKATTEASAQATGFEGGDGDDSIQNWGYLNVNADSNAVGIGVSVVAELLEGMDKKKNGSVLAAVAAAVTNLKTDSESNATGISGGTGNDTIYQFGTLNVDSDADATSVHADISVQGQIKGLGGGVTFADTSSTSTATATGISGGDGADSIYNGVFGGNLLHSYADAGISANSFTVTVEQSSTGVEVGGALAKSIVSATATATGIDGGAGDDVLANEVSGNMDVKADATANNLSASVDIQAGVKGLGVGGALVYTTTETTADAFGIAGGTGNDTIYNGAFGSLKSYAVSSAYAESFSVSVQGQSTGLTLGGALVFGSTTANSSAMGIDGGSGNDGIQNWGTVDANAQSTTNNLAVAVDVQGTVNGVGVGFAFTDATANATAVATGIAGGDGNDTITNHADGVINAHADADAWADLLTVNVQGSSTGIVVGGAIALADSHAATSAVGIDGGAGKNTLTNDAYGTVDVNADSTANSLAFTVAVQGVVEGFGGQAALTDTSTFSTATAMGIAGGDDNDTITNGTRAILNSHATANAYAESITVTVQGEATGVTLSGALSRGETTPTATATGIFGGDGADTLANDGFMDVKAVTDSTSVAVSARVVGVIEGISVGASLTDTSTTAIATAVGIDGGAGNDTITNYRTITSATDSTLRAASVSVDFGGVPIGITVGAALSRAAADATGTAVGINGGIGDDTITNAANGFIDVDSTAYSTSTAVSISANVIGAAWTDTSATTVTQAVGIAGAEGNDTIANLGKIDVDSNSTANVNNVSVNLIGATPVSGWTTSTAKAVGIDAGSGNNGDENRKTITADAIATTDADGVAVQVAGYSDMDITTNAVAEATGMKGGSGTDTLTNTKDGSIHAAATANADATAVDINLLGYSTADGKSTGTATAYGIFGDDGVNTITSQGSIDGNATVTATAKSYDIQLAGGATAAAGTVATATVVGILGGRDKDTLKNEGSIALTAQTTLSAQSRSYKFAGVGIANADSTATAVAVGMDGADGNNTITNASAGTITVSANASADAGGIAELVLGASVVDAATTSLAHSTGLKTGGGQDTIINDGALNVTAASSTVATSGTLGLFGLSFGDGLTTAIADGIDAGAGNDFVLNTGTITVGAVQDNDHPMAKSNVESVSISFLDITSVDLGAKAQATGILGGKGNDTIWNKGTITVGDEHWMSKGTGKGFTGSFLGITSVGAQADTISVGIDGGDGDDTLINDTAGVLSVTAASYASTSGVADTSFGSIAAFADAASYASATGFNGGNGNDYIENKGTINVKARTLADSYADADIGGGSPTADASTKAIATAMGIDAGKGKNFVENEGLLHVAADATAIPVSFSDANIGRTDSDADASVVKSIAYGVVARDGGNEIYNLSNGKISVTATADTTDDTGKILKASQDVDSQVRAGTVSAPILAEAMGIVTGTGTDKVFNEGELTIAATSSSSGYAYTSSNVYYPSSRAYIYSLAEVLGIDVGTGANQVVNSGTISLTALSYANPITDSWARDYVATTDANAVSTAFATGVKGRGSVRNISTGLIAVTARTTAYADSINEAEHSNGQATLTATATGISTSVDCNGDCPVAPDEIVNDGTLKVNALAGEDEDEAPLTSVDANSHIWVRDSSSSATGNADVIAKGIELGSGAGANLINSGLIEVMARENMTVDATAFSRDYNPNPVASSTGNATAAGVEGVEATYRITNETTGTMTVTADATAKATSSGTTNAPRYAWGTSSAEATSTAYGIKTGDLLSTIANGGKLEVFSNASASTWAWADAGSSSDGIAASTSTAAATAYGIRTGSGNDFIVNGKTISVTVNATSYAYAYADADGWGEDEISTTKATSNGKAWGIHGGDGDNTILNLGTLTVKAISKTTATSDTEDEVDNRIATVSHSETAVGIQTGSGNDRVGNYGTIVTEQSSDGGNSKIAGIAIATGAGDDTVALGAGSTTVGAIDLGTGNDTLMFLGTATVNGAIDPGSGSNTLVFDGTGTLGYAFAGFENTVKQGAGTFNLASLPTMKKLEVDEGTLHLGQSYAMGADSLYTTTIRGDGSSGRLAVDGNVTLAGGLNVARDRRYFYNGTTYDIITGTAVGGSFADIALPSNRLVGFTLEQKPDAVEITTHAKGFVTVAADSRQSAVAGYLDRIQYGASGDLLTMLGVLQDLEASEFGPAFISLSPLSYASFSSVSIQGVRLAMASLQRQIGISRFYANTEGQDRDSMPVLLAFAGSDMAIGPMLTEDEPMASRNGNRLWISGYGQWGDQENKAGTPGYDYRIGSGAIGYDHTFPTKVMLGASVSTASVSLDLDQHTGKGVINSVAGAVYGSYFNQNGYIDGSLSYGRNQYKNDRYLNVGAVERIANSKHDGNVFSANLGGGYLFTNGDWSWGPIGSLRYVYLEEEGFTETGADSLDLTVKGNSTKSLVSELGAKTAYVMKTRYGALIPELSCSLLYDFGIDDQVITASFAGAPDQSFSVAGQDVERLGAVVDVGLTFVGKEGLSLSLKYNGEFRSNYQSHGVMGQISLSF